MGKPRQRHVFPFFTLNGTKNRGIGFVRVSRGSSRSFNGTGRLCLLPSRQSDEGRVVVGWSDMLLEIECIFIVIILLVTNNGSSLEDIY